MGTELTRRFLLGGGLALLGQTAFADAPTDTMRPIARGQGPQPRKLPTEDQIIAQAKLSGDVSFAVVDVATGEPVAVRDAVRFQPPASVTKAVTAAFALDQLPQDFRFQTNVLYTGTLTDGVVDGDLILVGSGDPTLETKHLTAMVRRLKDAGIWRVTGKFIVSGGGFPKLFEIDPQQPPQVGYNPAISGLNLNFNRVRFDWARKSGGKYDITMQATGPEFAPDTPVSRMVTAPRDLPVYSHRMRGQTEEWSVARSALGKEGGRWLPTRVPELYAGEAFVGIARAMGLQISAPELGEVPENTAELASHESEDLSKILSDMLIYSTNLTAEVMGFAGSNNPTLPKSAAALTEWARGQGIGGAFADHSGLSEYSRVTAQGLANFMAAQADQKLPSVMRGVPLRKKGSKAEFPGVTVRAKTGSLNFVSTLSGYLELPSRRLAFAIVTSDMLRRGAIKPGDRERPAGGGTWAKTSRTLQFDLLRLWAQNQPS